MISANFQQLANFIWSVADLLRGLRLLKRYVAEGKDAERNRQRMDQIRASYIGYLDPVTLVPRSKLSLNRNNDDYYQRYLVPLEGHLPQRGFPASVHAMRKAFEWFERRLRDYVKSSADPGPRHGHRAIY
ncbi:hypothetical protein C8R30_11215 [Nitrosomonas nitrosa]|jgi:hypothetical protein|uniref:Uncharacterized protein n=1 Tax=Nitrosomonas nitrosa TaxID=52442 RepID=A0A8H8Z1N5_9PROT|nr:hypothetical protein [Nitrosomonas nitrosa]MCO6433962.1 hypothetical protein [Nitrosomonas nitrosa]PTQ97057.1 hypothetical protein C8R30_11215 [Nitrosomonas nitrosa]CAE6509566.1 hypothetical protein NMYAN_30188 [Nitrosomonas nitrosa]HNP50886.1 hypothetical protein [Nitrosomonas nitrosa]